MQKTIEELFAGLTSPTLQQEVCTTSQVAAHIVGEAALEHARVYTGFSARFATNAANGDILRATLAPNQVLPMWQLGGSGKHRVWTQVTALQLLAWSAVTYGGKLWLADKDPDKQDYNLATHSQADLKAKFSSGRDKLMAPGGRVLANIQEDFPCAVPFQHTPPRSQRPKVTNAMTPTSWLSIFGDAAVLDAERPSWQLVEIVGVATDESIAIISDRLYDPTTGQWMLVRPLALPVGFELAEVVLDSIEAAPLTLREVIFRGVEDYLMQNNVTRVGFAWFDDEGTTDVDGNAIPAATIHTADNTTRQFVYVHDLDEDNRYDYRRLGSASALRTFQNGGYEPDLG